ncbi:MAG: hypothetical protein KC462_01655, partial [Cyanobacteria bacterium HKST-UBA05]|nr:hypothetical protein [Cyanobacteria bacterium HKST-UBA05]
MQTILPLQPQALPATRQPKWAQTRFASAPTPGALLGIFDFFKPSISTVAQNKLAYGAIITSRVFEARSNEERREVLWRDPFGWYMWFMGNAFMQASLIFVAGQRLRPYLARPMADPISPLNKLVGLMFTPERLVHLTSDTQIMERRAQVLAAMAHDKTAGPNRFRITKAMFNKALNTRYLISFTGLAFTLITLGLGIPIINIIVTRRHVAERQRKKGAALEERLAVRKHATQLPQKKTSAQPFHPPSSLEKPYIATLINTPRPP